jgi:hypothetical protein
MKLTVEQMEKMLEAAKPLIKWMNKNCHPHCECIVDCTTVRIVEGLAVMKTEEYL